MLISMKVPLKWLNEYVDLSGITPKQFAEDMTMSGSKVEVVEFLGEEIENVVVGRILSVEKHPNADKLVVCMVDVGKETPIQIVTGASNVAKDDLVPVALHGSRLPGGVQIKKGKLRGVESDGMMCSIKELGLTLHECPYAIEDGILILAEGGEPGRDIREVLGLNDHVVEFEITPNRPDCLSIIGIAREAAATFGRELKCKTPAVTFGDEKMASCLKVDVENGELCSRYCARVVKNVKIQPSPKWMRERLHSAGVRPINNIVDITNYIMLEYGQPMHSFDFACISGGKIVVRSAKQGEIMTTLDGRERALTADMLVIADQDKPVALAGVMGGENSEIKDETTTVVFESANFNGPSIRQTSKALGLRSESSSRFEKGLDPNICMSALNRACELINLLGAGDVLNGEADINQTGEWKRVLHFDEQRINALLGTDIPREEMLTLLKPLKMTACGDGLDIPSFRADLTCMADIAEEVARMYGYSRITSTPFTAKVMPARLTAEQELQKHTKNACRALGFDEILTYTFISPKYYDKICLAPCSPQRISVTIQNPLGEDTSIMRTTALPSLLEIVARNASNQNPTASLFELATVYLPYEENGAADLSRLPDEKIRIMMGAYGSKWDFFRMKGRVEALLSELDVPDITFEAEKDDPSYHPGRCAAVYSGNKKLGVIGQIHPAVQENYGLGSLTFAAELDLDTVARCQLPEGVYHSMPRHPAVTRDLAVTCERQTPVAMMEKAIRKGAGALLEGLELFDVYTGSQIPADKKSVAYALTFRAQDRTLNDKEIDAVMRKVLYNLENDCGALIRS